MRAILLTAAVCAALACMGVRPAAALSCDEALRRAEAAFDAKSVPDARAVVAALDERCASHETHDQVERLAARTLYNAYLSGDPVIGDLEEALKEAGSMSRYWRVHTTLANIYRWRGEYNDAACALQMALADFDAFGARSWRVGSAYQDQYPGDARAAQVAALADEMGLALQRPPSCPQFRASCHINRNGRRSRVLPILFFNNSTHMTPNGQTTAEQLATCLKQLAAQRVSEIAIYGHASLLGGYRHNCRLSTRRAQAIIDFLRGQGVEHAMIPIGRGEEEPYIPVQGGNYDERTLEAMRRRVEISIFDPRRATRRKAQCQH